MKPYYLTIGKNTGKYELYYLVDTTSNSTWTLFTSLKDVKQYVDHYGNVGDVIKVMVKTPLLFPGTQEEKLKFIVDEILKLLTIRGVMMHYTLYVDSVD